MWDCACHSTYGQVKGQSQVLGPRSLLCGRVESHVSQMNVLKIKDSVL